MLDPTLAPAAVGDPGEIVVVGPVLARGYVGDPALTAERFVMDVPGIGRIYRTGDAGALRADGGITLLGRLDDQVKIRGHRVTLGEVEAAIAACDEVHEVAAIAPVGPDDDRRIIAFVAGHPNLSLSSDALRAHVAETLPAFMIPAAFVTLPALPRNANGKVDREALALLLVRPEDPATPTGMTELERSLARMFQEVLACRAPVGPDADFFALGGHSLLAARVATRVHREHGVDIPLTAFFEAATVRGLAAIIATRPVATRLPAITPTTATVGRLSHAQERLWFLDRIGDARAASAYSLPWVLDIRGPLDLQALAAALTFLVARHDALRTSFHADRDGGPYQAIAADVACAWATVDLTAAPDPRAAAAAYHTREAERPFDLTRPPLVRAALYRLPSDEHQLFVNIHHIVTDGWSNGIFRRELGHAYAAFAAGLQPALPQLPVRYLDHALWQRQHLTSAEVERQWQYWRERLQDVQPLSLPTDHPRPRYFSYRGGRVTTRVDRATLAGLMALARASNASLFMVLMAAFDALLWRYTGQRDVAVGTPVAGRDAPEVEGVIGFFVNTLVLRTTVDEDMSFEALVAHVKAVALEAFAHQDLPFERLVAELNPSRDLARHPIIQTVFALQNAPLGDVALRGAETTVLPLGVETTRFDLELHARERDGELRLDIVYACDLFEPWRMEALARHFVTLLHIVTKSPGTRLRDLSFLAPAELDQITHTWNRTERTHPQAESTVPALVTRMATSAPDAIALVAGARRLTYGALLSGSWRLARRLTELGIPPGARVASCFEPSIEYVVSAFGIALAGCVYVPLDPNYPGDRLQFMTSDAEASALVTASASAARCRSFGAPVVIIEEALAVVDRGDEAAVTPTVTGRDLAYIVYTSGSTGRPNGVAVEHQSLVNLSLWHIAAYDVKPADRATLIAAPAFDAAVWELWPYLIAGASLHVPPAETRRSPPALVAWLGEQHISLAFLPTPLAEACLDEDFRGCTRLRALLTGGDRLTRHPPANWPCALFNHYGPTEATVVTTAERVPPAPSEAQRPPAIGRPIDNVRVYLLDPVGNVVPPGVDGEIYIAGSGLARGYWRRPELTRERFVTALCGENRLYRSGDIGRYRPDGTIEFIGRRDAQVKLRGQRVELGEIDSVIQTCPGVRAALTLLRDDLAGEPRLVSYVVAGADEAMLQSHIDAWQRLYDDTYATPETARPEFRTVGWNSSFTGAPIPAEEMREWVDTTVAKIAALGPHRPRRFLEIGCGTGLLLFPLARLAERYVATDFSRPVIADVTNALTEFPDIRDKVELWCRPAHELGDVGGDHRFDVVILNSIVQYFPSVAYLLAVLAAVAARVEPGGRIFIGDVRNHDLLENFHRAVERARSGLDTPDERRVRARVAADKELTLSPALFRRLPTWLARIGDVAITPKAGRAQNEMTLFRYDVTLEVRDAPDDAPTLAGAQVSAEEASDPLRATVAATLVPLLRERLSARLPEVMVPSAIVVLPGLPLTANGKIDRRALPGPADLVAPVERVGATPKTATETALCDIFAGALGAASVGPRDNFFALGGHSLLAVRVVAKIATTLGTELPLMALFEDPTPEALARRVDAAKAGPHVTPVVPTRSETEFVTSLPLTPMDVNFHYGRLFFGERSDAWYQVLELEVGPLDVRRLGHALVAALNRHPRARAWMPEGQRFGPEVCWRIGSELHVPPLEVLQVADEPEARHAVDTVVATPFVWDAAPAFRFVYIHGGARFRLLVRYYHAVVDAAGLACLLDTIMSAYLGQRRDATERVMPFGVDELLGYHRNGGPMSSRGFAQWVRNNEIAHFSALLPPWLSYFISRQDEIALPQTRLSRPRHILPARIASAGGRSGVAGLDAVELLFTAEQSEALRAAAKLHATTLDRLFLVGLLTGADRWNVCVGGGARRGRVEAYWAVNPRPPRHFEHVVANHFVWSRVRHPHFGNYDAWRGRMLDPAADFLLRGGLDWMAFVDRFHHWDLPEPARRLLMRFIRRTAPSLLITNTLPFGEIGVGVRGDAFDVRASRLHSRLAFSDRPIIVIGQRGEQYHLRMVYPRSLFDAAGARQFLRICSDCVGG